MKPTGRWLVAVFAAGLALLPLSAAAAPAEGPTLDVAITNVGPAVLGPNETATITAQVTNLSSATVTGAELELAAQTAAPRSRYALSGWLAAGSTGPALATVEVPPLAPDAGVELQLRVEASDLGITSWGPRGIEVRTAIGEMVLPEGAQFAPDRDRSWIVWWDSPQVEPLPLGFLAPLTATTAELAAGGGFETRFGAVSAQGTVPGVTLLADPAMLSLPADPATSAARETVAANLRTATEVWGLPWARTDTEALVAAQRPALVKTSAEDSAAALTELGVSVAGSLDGTVDPSEAAFNHTSGLILLSPSSIPGWYGSGTPSSAVELGGRDALVLDRILGEVLSGTHRIAGEDVELTASQQSQLLIASTAILVLEDPASARPVFATLPQDDDGQFAALLAATAALPWVKPITISEAGEYRDDQRSPGTTILERAVLPKSAVGIAQLAEADLQLARANSLTEVVESPILATEIANLRSIGALAWRESPSERDAMLARASAAVAEIPAALRIVAPTSVLLVSESSKFPVTVVNELDTPATVLVTLEATDLRLQQVEPQLVTVAANTELRAEIPITAVGSGDLTVTVALRTPSGTQFGESIDIDVRMRAEWENFALATLILLALALFIFGVVRTVRRNVRENRAAVMGVALGEFEAQLSAEDQASQTARQGSE